LVSSRTIVLVTVIAVAALLVGYTAFEMSSVPGCVTGPTPTSFTVNGRTYVFTYVASCEPQREAGLMNRKVTNSTTMLFAFPTFGKWAFWMSDTNTSLDMIWVNATGGTGRVVSLALGTTPFSTDNDTPTALANYVIEAKAGFAAANGIQDGTAVEFS
jgi:uncharacterized membrane protein (UPF0127 family)